MSSQHPDAVCEVCEKTLPDLLLKRRFKRDHQPSLRALVASATRGCHACRIIHHNFAYTGYDEEKLDEGCVAIGRLSSQNKLRVFLSSADNEVVYGLDIDFCFALEDVQMCLAREADDEENVELVKALIAHCADNHPECASEKAVLPTRLLDVSPSGSTSSIRIVNRAQAQASSKRYITLSHCWGSVPPDAPWKLTKARISSYTNAIPLEILPLTFQHAIQYTRKLGEKYLWIDSLCIIQDSAEDWAREASQMATIYANSVCTLSAATASSSEGCLLSRDSWVLEPLEIDLGSEGRAFLVPSVPVEEKLQQIVPVAGRAWCLQERELTTRLLQFTSHQWLWSCKTAKTSERILRSTGISGQSFASKGNTGLQFHGADASLAKVSRADGTESNEWETLNSKLTLKNYNSWYKVVEAFARCQITYPSDRLLAIAGIAQRERSRAPDTYLAGLWQADLSYGLLWACRMQSDARPKEYIAPSWSWACLSSPVVFEGSEAHEDIPSLRLISAHIEYAGPDALGVVKGGYLRLRGRLKAARSMVADVERPSGERSYGSTYRSLYLANEVFGTVTIDTREDAETCDGVICLLVLEARGIALKAVDREDSSRPTYRRVGAFIVYDRRIFDDVEEDEFDLY